MTRYSTQDSGPPPGPRWWRRWGKGDPCDGPRIMVEPHGRFQHPHIGDISEECAAVGQSSCLQAMLVVLGIEVSQSLYPARVRKVRPGIHNPLATEPGPTVLQRCSTNFHGLLTGKQQIQPTPFQKQYPFAGRRRRRPSRRTGLTPSRHGAEICDRRQEAATG